jgi:hypothetical protein
MEVEVEMGEGPESKDKEEDEEEEEEEEEAEEEEKDEHQPGKMADGEPAPEVEPVEAPSAAAAEEHVEPEEEADAEEQEEQEEQQGTWEREWLDIDVFKDPDDDVPEATFQAKDAYLDHCDIECKEKKTFQVDKVIAIGDKYLKLGEIGAPKLVAFYELLTMHGSTIYKDGRDWLLVFVAIQTNNLAMRAHVATWLEKDTKLSYWLLEDIVWKRKYAAYLKQAPIRNWNRSI